MLLCKFLLALSVFPAAFIVPLHLTIVTQIVCILLIVIVSKLHIIMQFIRLHDMYDISNCLILCFVVYLLSFISFYFMEMWMQWIFSTSVCMFCNQYLKFLLSPHNSLCMSVHASVRSEKSRSLANFGVCRDATLCVSSVLNFYVSNRIFRSIMFLSCIFVFSHDIGIMRDKQMSKFPLLFQL